MKTSAVILSMTIFGALGIAALSAFSAVEQPANALILTGDELEKCGMGL